MVDASVLPFPARGLAYPSAVAGAYPYAATGAQLAAARRAANRERIGVVARLSCECTRQSCRESFPTAAERHRGRGDRFVVVPAHVDHGLVVGAADRFFVVEANDPVGPAARQNGGTR
jgi:hypothetical protein